MVDRRDMIAGAAATLIAAAQARASPDAQLFASGPLARNILAAGFRKPADSLNLPDTPLIGERGTQALSRLTGRTYLVSLWAEWCAPCLMEAGDLATLGQLYGGPSLGVVFVLTGSHKKLDYAAAHKVLDKYRAGGATLLVEPDGRDSVMRALATQEFDARMRELVKTDRGASLPCNLLVDRQGRIRGRSFGAASQAPAHAGAHDGTLSEADKARLVTQSSLWATPAGRELFAALAAGALEKT